MSDETIELAYSPNTTKQDKKFDAENLLLGTKAVFPELPEPFNHMYVKIRDLNSDRDLSPQSKDFYPVEERREHPAVEVGLRFSF